jgi:hypothetical protein
MKKLNNISIVILALITTLTIFSCGKETQSTTQGGGTFNLKLTISPPLQFGSSPSSGQNTLFMQVGNIQKQWMGNSASQNLSQMISDDISVTSGQNMFCIIQINNTYDFTCRTITAEGIQNGKVIKTYTLEQGYKNGSTLIMCIDGVNVTKNFIIQ